MASKEIDALLKSIDDKFGKGSLMRYGDSIHQQVSVIPTGVPNLDKALGIGGLPKGRIVEIYGPESSGKTTLSLHVLAQAQKMGGTVAFVDVEYALDANYAQALGVKMEDVLLSQPDSGEDALEIVERIVRSGQIDVVVIDSVAALVPRAEINGEMGDSLPGLQARLMSQACRKLVAAISQTNTLVIFINQLREKIGGFGYGSNEVTTGGKALKFYCSMRLDIRRIGAIKEGDRVLGNKTRLKVVKNKFSAPYKEVEFDIMYGEGISTEGDLLDLALAEEVITKNGAWFAFQGKNFAQGREKARAALKDPEFFEKVQGQLAQEKA